MSFLDGGLSGIAAGVGGALSGVSNFFGNQSALAFSKKQFDYQKEMAKNQLQWRVEDAKKAGLHPMAALGLGASSFSPVGVSQSPYDFSWIGQMGQSADYAAAKAKDRQEQQEALMLSKENARLQNENLQLQNQGIAQENEFNQWRMNAAMSGVLPQALKSPANASVNGKNHALISGQDDAYIDKPIVRDGWLLDEKGRKISLIPGADMKSRTEDVFGVEWFPFISSAWRDMKGRVFGQEIAGHKWDPARGYIPIKEWNRIHKNTKKGRISVQTYEDYYRNSYRYR